MGRDDYDAVAKIAQEVHLKFREGRRVVHSTLRVFLVQLWAVSNGRSVDWACKRKNWDARRCRGLLPDQTTMSRRLRHESYERFRVLVEGRLRQRCQAKSGQNGCLGLVKCMDGTPLEVAPHTTDPQATCGVTYGRRTGLGYRLHAIWRPGSPLPECWSVEPMNVDERVVAKRLLAEAGDLGPGYLLADGKYDDSAIYDLAAICNRRLLAPRARPLSGHGHHYQSPSRLRAIDTLEMPLRLGMRENFGKTLLSCRRAIERSFAHLSSRAGLLSHLPMWARRLHRVRQWVAGMLLLNAARHLNQVSRKGDA